MNQVQNQMSINDFLGELLTQQPAAHQPKKKTPKPATSSITRETRKASHEKTDKRKLYELVLETLGDSELTAREIAVEMHEHGVLPFPERAIIQPRITELVEAGKLEVTGKRLDYVTDRKVAVYKAV